MWVWTSEAGTGLEDQLYQTVRRWVADRWPFRRVAFPGRGRRPAGQPGQSVHHRSTTW